METWTARTLLAIGLILLAMLPGHSTESGGSVQLVSGVANPCAGHGNPCAMKNPCVAQAEAIDPRQITRPQDIRPFSGIKRSMLVEEGRMLFEDSSLSSNGMSCNSCHATNDMFGASFATPYPHPFEMARKRAGLDRALYADEVVQFCLIVPMKAQPFAWDSRELAALAAYVVDVKQKEFIAALRMNPCAMKNPHGMKNPCAMGNPCGMKH